MSENTQPTLNDLVSNQLAEHMPKGDAQPTTTSEQATITKPHTPPTKEPVRLIADDTVNEVDYDKMTALPTENEQSEIDHNNGSSLPPGTDDAIRAYEESMEQDFAESFDVRNKLSESGVSNGIIDGIDASKEKYASDEEKEKSLKSKRDEDDDEELSDEERERVFNEKYEASTVVIKKFGDGYLELTPEEQQKISTVKNIRVEDVETISIDTLRRKKKKKHKVDSVIKRRTDVKSIPVALPSSGYVAMLTGLSTHEVMLLIEQGNSEDPVAMTQQKWSIIYDHIVETSIGKLTFPEFMKGVSYYDYSMLVFGLLCATYPSEDKVGLSCNKCEKEYDHKYTMRSLIRTESISPELQTRIMDIIDASHTEDAARLMANNSLVQETTTIRLPESGYIVELQMQTANDFINNTVNGISELDDPRYQQAALMSTAVKTILVLDDEDEEESYIEYDDFESVVKLIFSLKDKDLIILTNKATKILEDKEVPFGFMNVHCPHCDHYSETLEVPIEQILFQRYQAAMTTTVD